MNTPLRPPTRAVPTLTDVVGFEAGPEPLEPLESPDDAGGPTSATVLPLRAVVADPGLPSRPDAWTEFPGATDDGVRTHLHAQARAHASAPALAVIDEELLIQHVLVDVQRQVDRMFEFRVRETIQPAFARLLEGFIQETRHDLELTLRDVVRRAVAQELARHRPR